MRFYATLENISDLPLEIQWIVLTVLIRLNMAKLRYYEVKFWIQGHAPFLAANRWVKK